MDENEDGGEESFEYEFELLNSEDMQTVTLVCHSSKPLNPDEYAQALVAFAERIESIMTMSELANAELH